jgi:hypothetical protein
MAKYTQALATHFPTFAAFFKLITPGFIHTTARYVMYGTLMYASLNLTTRVVELEVNRYLLNSKVNMYTEELRIQRNQMSEMVRIVEDMDRRLQGKK